MGIRRLDMPTHKPNRYKAAESLEARRLLASIIVNSAADNAIAGDGLTTLREAITAANNDSTTDTGQTGSGADQITFNLGNGPRDIQLIAALPSLDSDLSINGSAGNESVSIQRVTNQEIRIFLVTAGRTVTLENLKIYGGYVPQSVGGGVANLSGNLTIRSCLIQENVARFGGGIANLSGGVLNLTATTFQINSATSDGGGLYNGGSATFNDSTFDRNHANRWGGAAHSANASTLAFHNGWLLYNTSGDDAAGFDMASSSVLSTTDSNFVGNSAPDAGGAIRAGLGCTTQIERCRFASNQSAHGGAMFNRGLLEVTDTNFEFNFSFYGAGALDNDGGVETVTRCNFTSNQASFGGGAMWNHVNSTATVIECVFYGNSSGEGGAIENREGANLTIERSNFFSNNGYQLGGGAIFNYFGNIYITNSTFQYNYGNWDGGAINNNHVLEITGCTFNDNYAPHGGALFNWYTGTMSVVSSTIAGNSAGNGGGGVMNHGVATMQFVTVTDNLPGGTGVGAGVTNEGGSLTLRHSVVARNVGDDLHSDNLGVSADFSFIGETHGDPMLGVLADNGGPTMTVMPLHGSPLIDAGDLTFTGPPYFDQRGVARIIRGQVDIGAIEYNNATPTTAGLSDLTVPEDGPNSVVSLRDSFDDAEDGPAGLVYTIVGNTNPALFSSASIDDATDALTFNYADDANGVGAITVRATDDSGAYVESTFTVTVLSARQQADVIAQHVGGLSGLNQGQRTALLIKLNLQGNAGDAHKIEAFIQNVGVFAAAGTISAADAAALVSAAEIVLISLG
jgi:hypothetical protein